ncbi:MAG: hypothetical protein JXQ67_11510 [Campylobacterales bacterium]|nr:hypothetical protein [Campylobacterales bacterium]
MEKIVLLVVIALSGCANFKVNSTMCDQIASEPGVTVPQECRNYSEKEADKAFNKVVEQKKVSDKDIEFVPEEEK